MANVPDRFLEQLVEANVAHASAVARIADTLERMERVNAEEREKAINEVKDHMSSIAEKSDQRWNKLIITLGILLLVAQILGAGLDRLLSAIKG